MTTGGEAAAGKAICNVFDRWWNILEQHQKDVLAEHLEKKYDLIPLEKVSEVARSMV